jgi:hypothetical protein
MAQPPITDKDQIIGLIAFNSRCNDYIPLVAPLIASNLLKTKAARQSRPSRVVRRRNRVIERQNYRRIPSGLQSTRREVTVIDR